MHHRLVKCNYGLYFNIWDRLMGTNHPDYEKSFDQIVEKRKMAKAKEDIAVLPDELATE
jgi:sterol desaturase/sphingolipid hydroxylase (fatty acid hydroxylase superfamily)